MDVLPLGPYRSVRLPDGSEMPWYVIPFDREGRCTGPQTRANLLDRLAKDQFTDVFLFSHGWNNGWDVATARYEHFVKGFMDLRQQFSLPLPKSYKPLLVGLFWPSEVLTSEKERGPKMLGDVDPVDEAIAETQARIGELASRVPQNRITRFYELIQKQQIDLDEAGELAEILAPIYNKDDDEAPALRKPTTDDIVGGWREAASSLEPISVGKNFGPAKKRLSGSGRSASLIGRVLCVPRDIIRVTTVRQMKDRAGKVGSSGGRKLVEDLLGKTACKLHLIGHSYGAKLLLSALATATLPKDRKVQSILLLQPAVSYLCFADKVPGSSSPGGYFVTRDRVVNPIFATYSKHDIPLRHLFHLALWRKADRGEARIAADQIYGRECRDRMGTGDVGASRSAW